MNEIGGKHKAIMQMLVLTEGTQGIELFDMQLSLLHGSLLNQKVFCRQSAKLNSLWCLGRNSATTKPSQKMSLKWENKLENKWVQS